MLSEEPAVANAEYISYASPNALVYESETYQADMGQEAMEILYPDRGFCPAVQHPGLPEPLQ